VRPRFHQSQAKVLLTESPADLREQMDGERTTTRSMDRGSLLDYLVFGLDKKYEVVDARYRSGPREGEECTDWTSKGAQEAREEVASRGLLPVLQSEVDALMPKVRAVLARLELLRGKATAHFQPTIQWTSAADTECEGTPDCILIEQYNGVALVRTVDLKNTLAYHPDKFARQVHAMCWDVQGAAYAEAAVEFAWLEHGGDPIYQGHTILACKDGSTRCRALPLSQVYLEIGRRRWEKAQKLWKECLDSGRWPDYPESEVQPSLYVTRTELETYDHIEEEP
jgi:hypothetical protein